MVTWCASSRPWAWPAAGSDARPGPRWFGCCRRRCGGVAGGGRTEQSQQPGPTVLRRHAGRGGVQQGHEHGAQAVEALLVGRGVEIGTRPPAADRLLTGQEVDHLLQTLRVGEGRPGVGEAAAAGGGVRRLGVPALDLQLLDHHAPGALVDPGVQHHAVHPGPDGQLLDQAVEAGGVEVVRGQPARERLLAHLVGRQQLRPRPMPVVIGGGDARFFGVTEHEVAVGGPSQQPGVVRVVERDVVDQLVAPQAVRCAWSGARRSSAARRRCGRRDTGACRRGALARRRCGRAAPSRRWRPAASGPRARCTAPRRCGRPHPMGPGLDEGLGDADVVPLGEVDAAGGIEGDPARSSSSSPAARSAATVDLTFTRGQVIGWYPPEDLTVEQGDVGVGGEPAVAVVLEDGAHAFHTEAVQLRGAERSHGRCPDDAHSFVDGAQDLLVPHRQALPELSVDDEHGAGLAELEQGGQVALADRRQQLDLRGAGPGLLRGERGAQVGVEPVTVRAGHTGASPAGRGRGGRPTTGGRGG